MSQSLSSTTSKSVSKSQRKSKMIADLVIEMSWLLSQPPTCIGARIRPEEELANDLGVTRRQVREAIKVFTEKGVLVRRQGSGTYVRRVHSHPAGQESKTFGLTHEQLFLDLHTHVVGTQLNPGLVGKSTRSLRIGLWSDWHLSPPHSTTHFVLSMFMRHAQLAGHTMTVHTQVASCREALPVEEMARQLENASDDGFLVGAQYADTFLKARELSGSDCPYYFHIMGSGDFDLHPAVYVDTAKACENALNRFVGQGYQRIGTIAMAKSDQCDLEHHIHRGIMLRNQLEDSLWSYSQNMDVASGMGAFRNLLKKADGNLDAIYVANDMVLVGVVEAMQLEGLIPGKDIAVITLGNRGYVLPGEYQWSVMEFDPEMFASVTIRQLCHHIEYPEMFPATMAIQAAFQTGNTHLIHR